MTQPRRRRKLWLLGLAVSVAVVLGFSLLRGGTRRAEVELTPLERQVRRANAQARLVSLKAEVVAERPVELLRQQHQLISEQLSGLDSGEGPREVWDALELELAELDVQLAQRDRGTLATIDAVLSQLSETGPRAWPKP